METGERRILSSANEKEITTHAPDGLQETLLLCVRALKLEGKLRDRLQPKSSQFIGRRHTSSFPENNGKLEGDPHPHQLSIITENEYYGSAVATFAVDILEKLVGFGHDTMGR